MNFFKREIKIFLVGRLSQFLFPITVLLFSVWIVFALDSFRLNSLDIESFYNILPLLLAVLIPMLSYNLWQREIKQQLNGILLNCSTDISRIITFKILAYLTIFSSLLIFILPLPLFLSTMGSLDLLQLFSINLGLILFILFALSFTLLCSTLLKGRILNSIVSSSILITITFNNEILTSFYRGYIHFNNILNSIFLSLFILALSISIISKKKQFKTFAILGVLCLTSLFIQGSVDLTSMRSFTLTNYTKSTLSSSKEEFDIEYYFSSTLLTSSSVTNDIIALLNKFNNIKNVDTFYIDDSMHGFYDAVRRYQPEKDGGGELYNFIVIKNRNYIQVLPLIPYVETLEFEIMKVIKYFLRGGLKKVGIYIGNEEFTEDNFTGLNSTLSEHFNVSMLFPGDEISSELDALLVAGHYGINNTYTKEIGDYLSRGGNLIIAGNGLPTGENLIYRETPILKALKLNGIDIEPYLIGDTHNYNNYPLNVITYANRDLLEPSTVSPFTGFVGVFLSPVLTNDSNFKVLLYSSKEAWLVDSTTGVDGIPESDYSVAVYGEGNFSEGFGGDYSNLLNRLIVIGNSLSLTDYISSIDSGNNYDFITRALYTVTGDDELISIRHKFNWEKSFYKIERGIYRESILKGFTFIILIIYPLIVLFILTLIRRRSSSYS